MIRVFIDKVNDRSGWDEAKIVAYLLASAGGSISGTAGGVITIGGKKK